MRYENSELPEAREWLSSNKNPYALAGNRFNGTETALEFVERLYQLGAADVRIGPYIHDEPWRLEEEGGPYADSLVVTLPAQAQRQLVDILTEELVNEALLEEGENVRNLGTNEIRLWWD